MTAQEVGVLIVGGGQAGVQAAFSLRQAGYQEQILIASDESHLPYQRPPLSKEFLGTEHPGDALPLRALKVYERQRVDLSGGEKVEEIELSSRTATTAKGRELRFQHLLLATGGRSRLLDIPGAVVAPDRAPENLHYLRTLDDAVRLRNALNSDQKVVIIGGGFIGMEFAANAAKRECETTVLVARHRILSRTAVPVVSEFFTRIHQERGVEIRTGIDVESFALSGDRITEVVTATGERLRADLVVAGIGMIPNLSLARKLGVRIEQDAVFVDSFGRTSIPGVYAAGDCASFESWIDGDRVIRHESVSNAVDLAKGIAAGIVGDETYVRPEPWFWSDQYEFKLQTVGLVSPNDDLEVDVDAKEGTLGIIHYRGGVRCAVTVVNRSRDFLRARRSLQEFELNG